jgi:hypothetical protein
MALFLATRTRIELSRVTEIAAPPEETAPGRKTKKLMLGKEPHGQIVPRAEPLLTFEFGGNLAIGSNPSLRLKAYLPGNLLAELKLDIKSQRVAKLRKVLRGLLSVA